MTHPRRAGANPVEDTRARGILRRGRNSTMIPELQRWRLCGNAARAGIAGVGRQGGKPRAVVMQISRDPG